jgi:hypothetical protein
MISWDELIFFNNFTSESFELHLANILNRRWRSGVRQAME